MLHFMRRSLLFQLLSVYLTFVIVVLIGGVAVNAVVEQHLRNDAQASDQTLAQEIAVETSFHLSDAENSIFELSKLAVQTNTPDALVSLFQAFQAARSDVDQVYGGNPGRLLPTSAGQVPGRGASCGILAARRYSAGPGPQSPWPGLRGGCCR